MRYFYAKALAYGFANFHALPIPGTASPSSDPNFPTVSFQSSNNNIALAVFELQASSSLTYDTYSFTSFGSISNLYAINYTA